MAMPVKNRDPPQRNKSELTGPRIRMAMPVKNGDPPQPKQDRSWHVFTELAFEGFLPTCRRRSRIHDGTADSPERNRPVLTEDRAQPRRPAPVGAHNDDQLKFWLTRSRTENYRIV